MNYEEHTMHKKNYSKIVTVSLGLCLFPLILNANSTRGSIITQDNQVVAKNITENARDYPLRATSFEPILGYMGSDMLGKKGLERYANDMLNKGFDIHLNIPYAFQRKVELMLDSMTAKLDADEIIVGVMESDTGKVLSLASSKRYDPKHIMQKNIPALNPKFAEYPYEPGSVIKPLSISVAMDKGLVTPEQWFDTHDGYLLIGKKHRISDDDKFSSLSVTDIIVHSSNVGSSEISWLLTGQQFKDGLLKFGLGQPSGIDLSRDLPGQLKNVKTLSNKLHRANSSYGYGITATPIQLLKAYSAFNNDGVAVTPRLVNYFEDEKGKHYIPEPKVDDSQVISKETANQMHTILLEVVKRGTGVGAQYPGLEIGGKTGTAHMVKDRHYVREYHSGFYGFANDELDHKYTIGVLVIRAKAKHKYYASKSAVPTFRNIVEILVEEGKLLPKDGM